MTLCLSLEQKIIYYMQRCPTAVHLYAQEDPNYEVIFGPYFGSLENTKHTDGQRRRQLCCKSGLKGFCGRYDSFFHHKKNLSPVAAVFPTKRLYLGGPGILWETVFALHYFQETWHIHTKSQEQDTNCL